MRNFLNDYISSLNSGTRKRAAAILQSAKLEKSQLNTILERLNQAGVFANLVLPEEEQDGLIDGARIGINLRDANLSIEELYKVSNDISLILNSHTEILTADIAAMESELDALEKAISNYAFLLSDAKAYDYAYLETFTDSRGQDDPDWIVPDRGQLRFLPTEKANVDTGEGMLAIPDGIKSNYPMKGQIVASNVLGYITSNTGVNKAVNDSAGTGWRVAISSPSPVNATLSEFVGMHSTSSYPGALMVVEFTLDQPSPCDTIRLESFADSPFEIVQIRTYMSTSSNEYKHILDSPQEIRGVRNFLFPLQSVARFRVYLRQAEYKRSGSQPIASEVQHQKITSNLFGLTFSDNKAKTANLHRMTQLLDRVNRNKALKKRFKVSIPQSQFESRHGGVTLPELIEQLRKDRASSRPWTNSSKEGRTLNSIIRNVLYKDNVHVYGSVPKSNKADYYDSLIMDWDNFSRTSNIPPVTPVMAGNLIQNMADIPSETAFRYEYNIGLRSISIGTGARGFKGVFVSKVVPAPGDIGEVRLKTVDNNYNIQDTDRDTGRVTSIEYSVTNRSRPEKEEDWLPILPVDESSITGERFLPNASGRGNLRFPASVEANINLYKNGYITNFPPTDTYIYSNSGQSIIGLKIPVGEFSGQDTFTVDYTPAGDVTVVNFNEAGFDEVPLVSAFDEDGAGEGFSGTNGQLTLSLRGSPFIDYNEVADSTYSTTLGLTPYQPIILRLDDGTLATNLTNYTGGTQVQLSAGASGYQFIQNGNTLLLNKPITQGFRVYYQYMPSNVRVRIVLRANHTGFVSPKVDSYQIKAKTRKSDARRNM